MKVLVLGAGPIGLATSMLLVKDGHEVTVLEKDAQSVPATSSEVWETWERRGVAQFRQAHYMHARFRHVIDAELPAVRDELLACGGRPFNPVGAMTTRLDDRSARPGDERFESIAARRPIIESAFARVAEDTPGMKVLRGVSVEGPLTAPPVNGIPRVAGVLTSDGETYTADLVIDATGRRSKLAEWAVALGGRAPYEEVTESGFSYYTRYYEADALPEYRGGIVCAFDSFMVLTVPSDNGTWTTTLVSMAGDRLLKGLRHNEVYERVVRSVPHIAHWIDGKPLCDVIPMAGAMDRYRRIVLDGSPVVAGIVPIGDAWACTNPTAGRGISLGLLHACALRDALRSHGEDPIALAVELDRITEEHLTPWYRQQIERDKQRAREVQAAIDGRTLEQPDDPMAKMQRAFMVGASYDPDIARAFLDNMSVLALPPEIMGRPGIAEKVAQFIGVEPRHLAGPSRRELAALLAA